MEIQWMLPGFWIPAEIHSIKTIHNLRPGYLQGSCQGSWRAFRGIGKNGLDASFFSPSERTQESRTVNIRPSSSSYTSVPVSWTTKLKVYRSKLTYDSITVRRQEQDASPPIIESRASTQSYNTMPCVDEKNLRKQKWIWNTTWKTIFYPLPGFLPLKIWSDNILEQKLTYHEDRTNLFMSIYSGIHPMKALQKTLAP